MVGAAGNTNAKRYLSQVTLADAVKTIKNSFEMPVSSETVSLADSTGRIASESVYASYSVPPANTSAMDGIAVKSDDTLGASEQNPVVLKNVLRVNTGNYVPPEYDAVVMIEDTWAAGNSGEYYAVRKAARPLQNIRPAGEDIKSGELIIPAGHRIRPFDVGALGTYGISQLKVRCARAGLIPTGSELVEIGTVPKAGQVVESNIAMASAFLKERHVAPVKYSAVPDEPDKIRAALDKAVLENDIVIISAGSSAGTKDFTASVISEIGELIYHGVGIMPGKPMILGRIRGKPVIGLPGYPISAQVVLREIVGPLLDSWGFTGRPAETLDVVLASDFTSNVGFDEFVLLAVAEKDGRYIAVPQSRGAGVQTAVLKSNAYLRIPSEYEGFAAGETVTAVLTQDKEYADNSILLSGQNESVLGELSGLLKKHGVNVSIANTGGLGGVLALKKDVCHAAPLYHVTSDGEYNTGIVRQYLSGKKVHLLGICGLKYGIASAGGSELPSSPEKLSGLVCARQTAESCGQILFERWISGAGIDSSAVSLSEKVYESETAAVLAVKSGKCDFAFVSCSSAKRYSLTFTPLSSAKYEMAVRESVRGDRRIEKLAEVLKSDEFRAVLEKDGRYDADCAGTERIV